MVGGLVFSQLLTLYITPVVYTYMDSFQHWIGSFSSKTPPIVSETPAQAPTITPRRPRVASSR